jgi:hypothetical protein
MNKKTGKPRQLDSGVIHLADASRPNPQDPDAAVAAAVAAIFQSMPEIVDALITKAKAGSYLHANFLFNFAGADNREPGEDEDDQDEEQGSLVDFLMKRLDAEAAAEPHGLKSKDEEKKPVNGHQQHSVAQS